MPELTDSEWLLKLADDIDQAVDTVSFTVYEGEILEGEPFFALGKEVGHSHSKHLREIAGRISLYDEWANEIHRDD